MNAYVGVATIHGSGGCGALSNGAVVEGQPRSAAGRHHITIAMRASKADCGNQTAPP
jgi:hypothetical protein